jgi:hypothetical protein
MARSEIGDTVEPTMEPLACVHFYKFWYYSTYVVSALSLLRVSVGGCTEYAWNADASLCRIQYSPSCN